MTTFEATVRTALGKTCVLTGTLAGTVDGEAVFLSDWIRAYHAGGTGPVPHIQFAIDGSTVFDSPGEHFGDFLDGYLAATLEEEDGSPLPEAT